MSSSSWCSRKKIIPLEVVLDGLNLRHDVLKYGTGKLWVLILERYMTLTLTVPLKVITSPPGSMDPFIERGTRVYPSGRLKRLLEAFDDTSCELSISIAHDVDVYRENSLP